MSLHMLGAVHSASDVMDEIVHPLGKGVLSIFSPTLAQSVEDVEVSQGLLNTPASKAAKAAAASDQAKLADAITADVNAAQAAATALASTSLAASAPAGKMRASAQAKASADQAAGDAAFAAEDAAAVVLPAALAAQRAVPAQKNFAAAVAKLQKAPADLYAQSLAKAWQIVLNKVLSAPTTTEKTMSLHMLGAHNAIGFDWQGTAGGLLSTAGTIAASVKADEDAEKASAAEKDKANVAIAADSAAALAKATALTSAALAASAAGKTQPTAVAKASADQAALDIASAAQDAAGSAVPASVTSLRVAAAQKALAAATAKLQGSPTDAYAQSLVKAWQWVLNKVQNAQIVKNAPDGGKPATEEHWYEKKIVGPVKVWHAGAGVGVLGAIWFAVKKGLFHRIGIG